MATTANGTNTQTPNTESQNINGVASNSSTGYIGFYGTTPVAQRSGAVQATLATSTSSGTAITALLNEIRNTLVALGLMKGSA